MEMSLMILIVSNFVSVVSTKSSKTKESIDIMQ